MIGPRRTDLAEFWSLDLGEVFRRLDSHPGGLTSAEAEQRVGIVRHLGRRVNSDRDLVARQFKNPVVVLLLLAATMSLVFEEVLDSLVIVVIVLTSAVLGWVQERGAVRAIETLLRSVQVHADVLRDGHVAELFESQVVPGDVVLFNAGDVVPGDCRIVSANRLWVDESALTGESLPREKLPSVVTSDSVLADRTNMLFHGTHVVSGESRAVVVRCGAETEYGRLASSVARTHVPTSFERGITRYGKMLAGTAALLVVIVFGVDIVRGRAFLESMLFALALAVGIAPQMLPVIVTVSLAAGARLLARHHVVVKRLDAIEDIGSIDTLCVDKTGTLTTGAVNLVKVCDRCGDDSPKVLELASWNARLQRGFVNPIDQAIIAASSVDIEPPRLVDEVPFDFERRIVSVVVDTGDGVVVVAKGDVSQVFGRCRFRSPADRERAEATFEALSADGLRVLAVATRTLSESGTGGYQAGHDIERDLDLAGLLAFDDSVKVDAADAVARLARLGIRVKLITGDNRLAARHVAEACGIDVTHVLLGAEIRHLGDDELANLANEVDVFAETDPLTKQRIVRALSSSRRSVAFLGDGVNDAAALHSADVGISVESGVDVAKKVSDIVLLEKDLTVLADAVVRGRRVFANTLTYVKVTTSANFGNMVSLVTASMFLSYLPLLPLQILLLNFLSDIPGVTVATDRVDDERVLQPGRWDVAEVRRFMVVFGVVSTAADLATFAVMLKIWNADTVEVRTGWFTVSLITEVIALLVLRTVRPVWRSRPSRTLTGASVLVAVLALAVAAGFTPGFAGFTRLQPGVLVSLLVVVWGYATVTEVAKRFMSPTS